METKAANWSDQLTPEQAAEKVKSLATGKPISPTVGQHVGDFLHTTGSPLHWPSIREATIGGGVAGIGIGAILALVHQMRLQRKLKEIKTPPDVDEDTLTLNLPPGAATKLAEILTSPISVSTTSPMKSNKKVPVGSYRQPSYHNKGKGPTTMKISMDKSSGASWQTVLMELLGGTAAGIGGYKLTDMLYKNYVDRQLKKQEDSARQEMMTQLMAPKTGTWLDDAVQLPMCKDSQSAREPTGVIPAGLAGTIFLTLLATGGTAYLTKKLLDAKFHEATDEGYNHPKVRKIVFRTTPQALLPSPREGEKVVEANDKAALRCVLISAMDTMNGQTRVLDNPTIKESLSVAGMDADKLYEKLASDAGIVDMYEFFLGQPATMTAIQKQAATQYPVLRMVWADLRKMAAKPGLADAFTKVIAAVAKQQKSQVPQATGLPTIPGGVKAAEGFPFSPVMMASYLGSEMAEKSKDKRPTNLGEKPIGTINPARVREMLKNIRLEADDPSSVAFLDANKKRIASMLQDLALEGKI